jgi:transcriptional regulator with XRE-family HTH domain
MSTKLSKQQEEIKKVFGNLFKFKSTKEEEEHEAGLLSLSFISEFNKVMDNDVTKGELASRIGKTPSYITQLFRGNKLLNMVAIAKIQKALGIKFEIKAIPAELQGLSNCDEINWNQEQIQSFINRLSGNRKGAIFYYNKPADTYTPPEISKSNTLPEIKLTAA